MSSSFFLLLWCLGKSSVLSFCRSRGLVAFELTAAGEVDAVGGGFGGGGHSGGGHGGGFGWGAVCGAWGSPCDLAIASFQDVLGLGADARMNAPGTMGTHNWGWRVRREALNSTVAGNLRQITQTYGRLVPDPVINSSQKSEISEKNTYKAD